MISLPQFWFGFLCFFTPGMFYDPFLIQFYDLLFTLIPIIMYGVFDREYSKYHLQFSPNLYFAGLKFHFFNNTLFLKAFIEGVAYSLMLTLSAFTLFDWSHFKNGHTNGFWFFANVCLLGNVLFSNLKIFSFSQSYTLIGYVLNALGIILYLGLWYWQNLNLNSTLYDSVKILT